MSTLTETYMRRRPVQHRVTVLDTDKEIHYFSRTTDCYPEPDGMFRRDRKDYTRGDIPLLGSVFVEELDEDGDRIGRFDVLTSEEFRQQFTEHEEPYFEYGIQLVARPRDVVEHGTRERCVEVLDEMAVLRDSGEHRIVPRSVTEPGPWEPLE